MIKLVMATNNQMKHNKFIDPREFMQTTKMYLMIIKVFIVLFASKINIICGFPLHSSLLPSRPLTVYNFPFVLQQFLSAGVTQLFTYSFKVCFMRVLK